MGGKELIKVFFFTAQNPFGKMTAAETDVFGSVKFAIDFFYQQSKGGEEDQREVRGEILVSNKSRLDGRLEHRLHERGVLFYKVIKGFIMDLH